MTLKGTIEMSLTIQETIRQLHSALRDYIEATYHIGSPALIAQRKELLGKAGVIHQAPYLESTPRYQSGAQFAAISGLPKAALTLFERLSRVESELPALLYDPPYKHQSDAIHHALVEKKNLVIMTGTGSGKTLCQIIPNMLYPASTSMTISPLKRLQILQVRRACSH